MVFFAQRTIYCVPFLEFKMKNSINLEGEHKLS